MLPAIYLVVVALFGWYVLRHSYVLVRPSMWFSLVMLLEINGAAALAYIDEQVFFDQNRLFRLLAVLFPLGVMLWVHLTPRLSAQAAELFGRCRTTDRPGWNLSVAERQFAVWIVLASACVLFFYCRKVPIRQSGLVAVLSQFEESALARDESLKLLESPWLRYAYLLHMAVLGPFLAAAVFLWHPRERVLRWLRLPLIAALVVSVMLTGARAPAGALLLGLAIIYLLRKGIRRGGLAIGMTASAALLIATTLTVFRQAETEVMSADVYGDFLVHGIFRRTFVVPFETGLWTNLYAEEYGLRGVQNIRPLAVLFGHDYEWLSNVVALEFAPNALESCSANTCFLFDFQASFGLVAGWGVSLMLLCLLDSVLYLFRGLSSGMLLICAGMFLLRVQSLISSSYTACLVSHGLLPVVGLATVYSWVGRRSAGRKVVGRHDAESSPRPLREDTTSRQKVLLSPRGT